MWGRKRIGGLLLLWLLAAPGCGYRVGGQASRVPASVKVFAVPAFKNQTTWMRLEQRLTRAVMEELIQRTRYKVVGDADGADAVLEGTVLSATASPVVFDPTTGRASVVQVEVAVDVTLRDLRDGQVLYSNPNFTLREQYEITGDLESFFEEREPALGRMAQDFAATLVSAVLENF